MKRIDQLLFIACLAIIAWAVFVYSAAAVPEILFRLGVIPIERLRPSAIDVIDRFTVGQNIAFFTGYVLLLAGAVQLIRRRRSALYLLIAAGVLERLDWAMMPQSGSANPVWLGFVELGLFLGVVVLLSALLQRGILR